jgi:hypothetical protein
VHDIAICLGTIFLDVLIDLIHVSNNFVVLLTALPLRR